MNAVNAHLRALNGSYLFSEIGRRVSSFSQEKPKRPLIRLGIGDVTRPIAPAVIDALVKASREMGQAETFRGYAPANGYPFLIDAINSAEYAPLGVSLSADEVYVSDGAKSDTANFQELFSKEARIAVCDPVYPVYQDSNLMAGREVFRLPCTEKTGFLPEVPDAHFDVIYLCSPNNPTGAVLSHEDLAAWVKYAHKHDATLLFDAAYRAYISDADVPRSVFQIDGAKDVAVEFCSFSKSAGFTGLRCAYTIVPEQNRLGLGKLWARRVATKFNGVSYPIQRAAEAALSEKGRAQASENITYYMENASILRKALSEMGYTVFGGEHAPYVWVKCPRGLDGWSFFDVLLKDKQIVATPGEGFGECGAGYVRFSAFATREDTKEAMERLSARVLH